MTHNLGRGVGFHLISANLVTVNDIPARSPIAFSLGIHSFGTDVKGNYSV